MNSDVMLFKPIRIKSVEVKNRIWMSPMCQYSCQNGFLTDWHLVHLGSRAVGGAGLVMVEATAVTPEGRISPDDSGIWSDDHISGFRRINDFLHSQGSASAIQLAHAGRKASTSAPWLGHKPLSLSEGGWETIAPSSIPFNNEYGLPKEMSRSDIDNAIESFKKAAIRSRNAGFRVLELHMAHGYLMHEFLSPISNKRTDNYGGSLENRMRFPLEVTEAVRSVWPDEFPFFVRISATDWCDGENELTTMSKAHSSSGWNLFESIEFCKKLKELGVDLIDCSSGGTLPRASIPIGPGYQVTFAAAIRKNVGIMTAAVGMITDPEQAEEILCEQKADAIFIGRELLRNPYWPQKAARELKVNQQNINQYARAW